MNNETRILSPQQVVVRAFGGVRPTARAIGYDCAKVSRWGQHGLIPAKYQRVILQAAWDQGIDLTANDLIFGRPV